MFYCDLIEECIKEINKDLECSQLLYSRTEDVIGEFSDIKEVEGKYRIFEKVDCYLYLITELEYTNDQNELSDDFLPKAREFILQLLKVRVLDLCYFRDNSTRESLKKKWNMDDNYKEALEEKWCIRETKKES